MSAIFDPFAKSYATVVNDAVAFSGKDVDYYLGVKAALLLDLVATLPAPVRLLDVGCGTGIMHGPLARASVDIHGVDVSAASLDEAAARNPQVDYRHYDGRRLPYDDQSFDVAFACCVLHHVAVADWTAFVAEMARVVRPGGMVVVFEHNPFNPLTRWVVSRCALDKDAVLVRPSVSRRLMEEAGLTAVTSRFFLVTPFSATPFGVLDAALARLPLGAQYMTLGRVR